MSFILLYTVVLSTFDRSAGWLLAGASLTRNLRYRTNSDPREAGSPI